MHKKYRLFFSFVLTFFCLIFLTGCGSSLKTPISPINDDWLCRVNYNPERWSSCSDKWFKDGEPNAIDQCNLQPAKYNAKSLTQLNVPAFNKIVVNGDFQVQIVGRQPCSSLFISGPYRAAQQIKIDSFNGLLTISQPEKPVGRLNQVIIRIGVNQLQALRNRGCGNVYGLDIVSGPLTLLTSGRGSIMLKGYMNVTDIKQLGSGSITVMGAQSKAVNIWNRGSGDVNISGRVGAQSVINSGTGRIHIIGLDSRGMAINASGRSITSAAGLANLRKVVASQNSQVYLYWVASDDTVVETRDFAKVGLAGNTLNLTVTAANNSQFEGQYLRAYNAYVRTFNSAHVNVMANYKLFMDSQKNSHIYYFGSPPNITQFAMDRSYIIPAFSELPRCQLMSPSCLAPRAPRYQNWKGEK